MTNFEYIMLKMKDVDLVHMQHFGLINQLEDH